MEHPLHRPTLPGFLFLSNPFIVENIKAIVAAVQAAKPATVKGVFIKSMTVSSTMGIGVPVQIVGDAE